MVTLISFLVMLGVVVIVHEWGHFITARRNGVRVEKFSIGLGPKLFSKKVGDTEYVVSAIPLGGYVKMAGENQDEIRNLPDEFSSKTLWQRGKIVFAGPAINIVLAFLLMPLVYMIGIQEPKYLNEPAKIGWVEDQSTAQVAGLKAGDLVIGVANQPIENWKELREALMSKSVSRLEIKREDKLISLPVTAPLAGLYPDLRPVVQKVLPGKPAERAGLQEGDILLSIDQTRITSFNHFLYLIQNKAGKEINLEINRGGTTMIRVVTPLFDPKVKKVILGISMGNETLFTRYGLLESIQIGTSNLVNSINLTFSVLGRLVTGKLSLEVMGGPVQIAQMSGQAAKTGLGAFIFLMAMISLQLGIFNLLPIPVLDGGWIVLFILEGIQGHPLSKKVINAAQFTGFSLLMGLMVYVTFNDIMKLFR
ncbi:MAG: RIP metalloprotease RseP [Nitrospiria bacterium]